MRKLSILILLTVFILPSGCDTQQLPEIKHNVTIAINVPAGKPPTTKRRMVTLDVQKNREIFLKFHKSAKQIGMCSPTALKRKWKADEVMSISYGGGGPTFTILKTASGRWLNTGYGIMEIIDHPEGFLKYRYSRKHLNKVRHWYEHNVAQASNGE